MNQKLKEMAIQNAISSWNDKKNNIYKFYETKKYSVEFCETQIKYFENLLLTQP